MGTKCVNTPLQMGPYVGKVHGQAGFLLVHELSNVCSNQLICQPTQEPHLVLAEQGKMLPCNVPNPRAFN